MLVDGGGGTDPNGLNVSSQSAGGNGFQFSAVELQSVLGEWQKLQTDLSGAINAMQPLMNVNPAASDTASNTASAVANDSGVSYFSHLVAMNEYANAYITALTTALNNYHAAEAAGHQSAANVGTGLIS